MSTVDVGKLGLQIPHCEFAKVRAFPRKMVKVEGKAQGKARMSPFLSTFKKARAHMASCLGLKKAAKSPTLQYSHFISLPLALHPELVKQVAQFQDSVLNLTANISQEAEHKSTVSKTTNLDKSHGIEESIFIKPATLHLTVLMLQLSNKESVAAAAKILQGLKLKLLEVLEYRPFAIRLHGVECLKGSPAKAHVLYAKVEEVDQGNRLSKVCKLIIDAFSEAGLVLEKDKKRELKLHVTLMNTQYRKRKRGEQYGKRIPFDARQILSKHGTQDWGEHPIVEVHLSQRFAYGKDGYYHCCGSIQFPHV